jgi:hypothetical protein
MAGLATAEVSGFAIVPRNEEVASPFTVPGKYVPATVHLAKTFSAYNRDWRFGPNRHQS